MHGIKEEDFKKNNAFSLYDLYGNTLTPNSCPGGYEIYNLGRPYLSHIDYILSLSDLCLGVKKKNFKGIMHFHYMTYPSRKRKCPGGH